MKQLELSFVSKKALKYRAVIKAKLKAENVYEFTDENIVKCFEDVCAPIHLTKLCLELRDNKML